MRLHAHARTDLDAAERFIREAELLGLRANTESAFARCGPPVIDRPSGDG